MIKLLITPVPKPRMTQASTWKPAAKRFYAFRDQVRLARLSLPDSSFHAIFVMPMPKSWSKTKRAQMDGQRHTQRPDKDNLEKALLDAVFGEDCHVWDSRVTKIWGETGMICIKVIDPPDISGIFDR